MEAAQEQLPQPARSATFVVNRNTQRSSVDRPRLDWDANADADAYTTNTQGACWDGLLRQSLLRNALLAEQCGLSVKKPR